MKIIVKIIVVLIYGISIFSCSNSGGGFPKPPPKPKEDTIIYPLTIKWETYFYADTTAILSSGVNLSYKNLLIFNAYKYPGSEYVHIFDKETGEQIKKIKLGLNGSDPSIMDHYLILPSLDNLTIIDLDKLEIVKQFAGDYNHDVTIFRNNAYVELFHSEVPYLDSSSIMKVSFPSMEMEKIFTVTKDFYGGFASLNPVSVEENAQGDRLIYGTMATIPYLLYCYNESQGDFVWKSDRSGYADKYFSQPQLDEEHVYITMGWGAEAYDKKTGKQVWRTELDGHGGYRPCQPLLFEGRLYLKEANGPFYCLNASDGSIVWYDVEAGGAPANYMVHHDGLIYYSSDSQIKIIEMSTGEILFQEHSPYEKIELDRFEESKREFGLFDSVSPLVDVELGVFYLSDGKRMFCFELPEL